jgi:hypothetical protein
MTATHTPVRPVADRDRRRACRVAHAFGAAITGGVALLLVTASQFRTHPVPLPALLAAGSAAAVACGLAADLLARPARVSLTGSWLTVTRLGRSHRVRTEHLVGLAPNPHAAGTVVLTDQAGNRAEIDVRCLARNPLIWQQVNDGVTRARRRGALELSELESRFWQSVIQQVAQADQRALTRLDFNSSA